MPETTARPLRADAERNRQRLLGAASELFAEKGLGVGLDEIARHAGVGVGTAYRRFPDKETLIAALFEQSLDEMAANAERALADPDPWQALVQYMEGSVELHIRNRGLKQIVFGSVRSERYTTMARERMAPIVAAILARAQEAGVVRADLAPTDLPLMQFALSGAGELVRAGAPDAWRRLLGIVLDGLRTPEPTPLRPAPLEPRELSAALVRS